MNMNSTAGVQTGAGLTARPSVGMDVGATTLYTVECRDEHGNLKWVENFHNTVVTAGLNELLDKTFKGSTYTAAWYVGLTDGTPTVAAGDVMNSHAGWAEVTDYDEAVRQTLTLGTVSSGSVDNSASKAVFTISGTTTVGGAFLTTVDTKGGTTGTLYGAGAFTEGDRSVVDNDTLTITVTLTVTAS